MTRNAFASRQFGSASFPERLASRSLGQTWDQMMELPAWCGDCVRLVVHGSTGVMGIYLGTLGKGLWSALGWIVGIVSSFAAVLDIASILGRLAGKEK